MFQVIKLHHVTQPNKIIGGKPQEVREDRHVECCSHGSCDLKWQSDARNQNHVLDAMQDYIPRGRLLTHDLKLKMQI